MISWNDVLEEIQATKTADGRPDLDSVRRGKMRSVAEHTGRPLIVYACDFLGKGRGTAESNIDFSDKDGFLEVASSLPGDKVDVLLHSGGGLAEAAEGLVRILRSHFTSVRFIIPQIAKSAATMLALSGDEIVMDTGSELGPIDPQFSLPRADGTVIMAPAQAILDQHAAIVKKIKADPRSLPAYIPILQFYAPSLERQAKNAIDLSRNLVKEWLATYMFREEKPARRKRLVNAVARYLSDHNKFKSHAKGIYVEQLKTVRELQALRVVDLSEQPELQSLLRGLHYAIGLTFSFSTALKIFENSTGRAMIRHLRAVQIQVPPGAQQLARLEHVPLEGVKPA